MTEIIIIGSGGHAAVVIDIIHQMTTFTIYGVTSLSLKKGSSFCGYPVLGDDSVLEDITTQTGITHLAMGIGGFKDNIHRTKIYNELKSKGFIFINAIHPFSSISSTAKIGEGVTVYPGAIINTEVKIGNNVIIATGASIDHETTIEENVLISSGSVIGAYTLIKNGTMIALGSKIISGLIIGSNSLIAAGAVVVNDVPDNSRVYGVPAKAKP